MGINECFFMKMKLIIFLIGNSDKKLCHQKRSQKRLFQPIRNRGSTYRDQSIKFLYFPQSHVYHRSFFFNRFELFFKSILLELFFKEHFSIILKNSRES